MFPWVTSPCFGKISFSVQRDIRHLLMESHSTSERCPSISPLFCSQLITSFSGGKAVQGITFHSRVQQPQSQAAGCSALCVLLQTLCFLCRMLHLLLCPMSHVSALSQRQNLNCCLKLVLIPASSCRQGFCLQKLYHSSCHAKQPYFHRVNKSMRAL